MVQHDGHTTEKNKHDITDEDFRKNCYMGYDRIFKAAFLNEKNLWIVETMLNEFLENEEIKDSIIQSDHLQMNDVANRARICDARLLSLRKNGGHIHTIVELNSVFNRRQEFKNYAYAFENVASSDAKKLTDEELLKEMFILFNMNYNQRSLSGKGFDIGYIPNIKHIEPSTFSFIDVDVAYYKNEMYNMSKSNKYETKGGDIKHVGLLLMNEDELRVCAKFDYVAKAMLDILMEMKSNGMLRELFTPEQEQEFIIKDAEDIARKEGLEQGREEGLEQGEQIGLEKGREEGREEVLENTAKNLYAMDMSDEVVQKATGLSKSRLKKIRTMMLL